jgi:hypothetical protein
MDEQADNIPFPPELQEAIRDLSKMSTEELLKLAEKLSVSDKSLYGRDEIITAMAIVLHSRNALPGFNGPPKPDPFKN